MKNILLLTLTYLVFIYNSYSSDDLTKNYADIAEAKYADSLTLAKKCIQL